MRIFAAKLKIINNEITNQREEGMKIRIATITFMLLTMSIQLWCGNHKFKSDYIDSLHTDVENHIYDKDVTKRIDKLMKASKTGSGDRYLTRGEHFLNKKRFFPQFPLPFRE